MTNAKIHWHLFATATICTLYCWLAPDVAQAETLPARQTMPNRPNILIIVADDLGYSDLGAFGGEIDTPSLDALAKRGTRLTGFYVAPTCSPTRAMLLTGSDHHEVGLGTMAEILTPRERGAPGYEGYLTQRAATLAERMRDAGYATLMSGKWHLGAASGQTPASRGFDHSFALLQGAHNHFGADQEGAYLAAGAASDYQLDGQPVRYPVGAYSADYFTDRMIAFLSEPRARKPFFAYLTFTQPHWPLQAPAGLIAKYRGRYADGPDALREQRLQRMKKMGLIPTGVMAHPVTHPVNSPEWSSLSPADRAIESRKMEVYAAMVDRMDQNIGRVISTLRTSGQLDDTIIIFMSDNGPEGMIMNRPPVLKSGLSKSVNIDVDNSLDNLGNASSYASYGPWWAQAGSAPYQGTKEDTTEGGIHSPAIVAGPGVLAGKLTGALLHVTDITPTVLDVAHIAMTDTVAGKKVLRPEGRSWAALLAGHTTSVRSAQDVTGWELFYQRAIRRGNMKAVFLPYALPLFQSKQRKPGELVQWQLFDLGRDPGETHDLAAEQPGLLRNLVLDWQNYAAEKGVVLLEEHDQAPAALGTGR